MGPVPGFAQQELGTARNDLFAECKEVFQEVNEVQLLRSAISQGDIVDAER